MISVIICSKSNSLLDAVVQNIRETIGCPFELLAVDNGEAAHGICAVYNSAAARATGNIICFLHEDVRLHSQCWGQVLTELLADSETGLVGVSGSIYKSRYAGAWSACPPHLYRINTMQHFTHEPKPVKVCVNPEREKASRVAVIDGVFMATRRDVFDQLKFDSTSFRGFHGYDIDYSLQVGGKYKVMVSHEILLEHFSEGKLDRSWLGASLFLHRKWRKTLPVRTELLCANDEKESDYRSCLCFLNVALQHKGYEWFVLQTSAALFTRFLPLNGLKYTKKIVRYLLQASSSGISELPYATESID